MIADLDELRCNRGVNTIALSRIHETHARAITEPASRKGLRCDETRHFVVRWGADRVMLVSMRATAGRVASGAWQA
jgi:hypothetical protein